jgi:hypothetical protein
MSSELPDWTLPGAMRALRWRCKRQRNRVFIEFIFDRLRAERNLGAELIVEGQDAKVGQHSLVSEGIGCEVRRSGDFGAFADNLSHSRERRHDAIACLPAGDGSLGVTRESQKPIACPSNVLVVALTTTPQLSPTSDNGRVLIGDMIRNALSRQPPVGDVRELGNVHR